MIEIDLLLVILFIVEYFINIVLRRVFVPHFFLLVIFFFLIIVKTHSCKIPLFYLVLVLDPQLSSSISFVCLKIVQVLNPSLVILALGWKDIV